MEILAGADVFVGGSTGPLHIAAAVGTRVIGLFGPIFTTTPDRWGPCGWGHTVFVPDVPVCRCRVGRCRLGNCMDRIELRDILAACRGVLNTGMRRVDGLTPNETAGVSDLTPRES